MDKCAECKYAVLDFNEYYGTSDREWFVCDCLHNQDVEQDECEEFERREEVR